LQERVPLVFVDHDISEAREYKARGANSMLDRERLWGRRNSWTLVRDDNETVARKQLSMLRPSWLRARSK
jgi:hypothetical protein